MNVFADTLAPHRVSAKEKKFFRAYDSFRRAEGFLARPEGRGFFFSRRANRCSMRESRANSARKSAPSTESSTITQLVDVTPLPPFYGRLPNWGYQS